MRHHVGQAPCQYPDQVTLILFEGHNLLNNLFKLGTTKDGIFICYGQSYQVEFEFLHAFRMGCWVLGFRNSF